MRLDTKLPLTRGPLKERPSLQLAPEVSLAYRRVHEACGAARRVFALWLASQLDGPVVWITPAWESSTLNPAGIARFLEPARLTLVATSKEEDVLWCMEETLTAGCAPLVIAEIASPPALTPVRRLHLAAEKRQGKPIGLLLSAGEGGAQGVESRWQMEPQAGPAPRWNLTRTRARTAPVKRWDMALQHGQITQT